MKWFITSVCLFISTAALAEEQKIPWWKFWASEPTSEEKTPEKSDEQTAEKAAWWKFWGSDDNGIVVVSAPPFNKAEHKVLNRYFQKNTAEDTEEVTTSEPTSEKPKEEAINTVEAEQDQPATEEKETLARGDVLDQEAYDQSQAISAYVMDFLPDQPAGTSIRQIEGHIIRIINETRVIVDVIAIK